MRRLSNIAQTLMFLSFIVLPLVWLAIHGSTAPYGRRDFTEFPNRLSGLIGHSDRFRQNLASALFERSQATVWAITGRNWFLYRLAGYIDDDRIVSGKDGWLFHKDQFWRGRCLGDDLLMGGLDEMWVMSALAKAAGIDLIFSISPDKAWIYPERLHPRATAYVGCKLRTSARWRELAKNRMPGLIDHGEVLLKAKSAGRRVYYPTDTHWTEAGQALASRQLAQRVYGIDAAHLPAPKTVAARRGTRTDLRNAMLLQVTLDLSPILDRAIERRFGTMLPRQKRSALVIHDSFYGRHLWIMAPVFRSMDTVHINKDESTIHAAVLNAGDLVVVNSVERALFSRLGNGKYGMRGTLGRAILARNRQAATACTFAGPPLHADNGEAPLTIALPAGTARPCLRVRITLAGPTVFRLFLPKDALDADGTTFEPTRTVALDLASGPHDIRLLLPAAVVGREVRLRLGDGSAKYSIDAVQVGTAGARRALN